MYLIFLLDIYFFAHNGTKGKYKERNWFQNWDILLSENSKQLCACYSRDWLLTFISGFLPLRFYRMAPYSWDACGQLQESLSNYFRIRSSDSGHSQVKVWLYFKDVELKLICLFTLHAYWHIVHTYRFVSTFKGTFYTYATSEDVPRWPTLRCFLFTRPWCNYATCKQKNCVTGTVRCNSSLECVITFWQASGLSCCSHLLCVHKLAGFGVELDLNKVCFSALKSECVCAFVHAWVCMCEK